jgi:hypothetical protein
MEKYKDSIVAKDHSKIKNVIYGKKRIDKPSFWRGFISGIISSFLASVIFYLILELLGKN